MMNDEMGLLRGQKTNMLYEEKWPTIRPIVLKLLQQLPVSQREYHELFYTVHVVCMWDDKGPAKLREALREEVVHFIKGAQERVLSNEDDQALLKSYIAEWRKFFTQCDFLPSPFRQLEITLLGKIGCTVTKKPADIQESAVRSMMLEVWNTSIFSDIKHRLQGCAMKLVKLERKGVTFDSQLVVGVRQSYVSLCSNAEDKLMIYRDNFEKAYLESTERFFRSTASEYARIHGVREYMRYADSKLREEEMRAQKYLEPSGVNKLVSCCVEVLVTTFKTSILAECPSMITNNNTEELNLMFKLLDRIPDGIEPMLRSLEDHIVCTGLADMIASAPIITQDCEKYVEQLLRLFNQFSELVKDAFNIDPRFLTARDKAFKRVVDDTTVFKLEFPTKQSGNSKALPESKCPELLANYCDMLLRRTPLSKRLTSDDIERKLHDVLLVLKYVQNKDVFMRYHKAHLTRRLILDTSADSEKEENMVEWLREVGMPADYVNKLSRMFQDIKVSEDLNQQFKARYRSAGKNSMAESINIKILNAGAWARYSERVTVSLPLELEDYIPEIEEFYKANHSGRKLQWYHHMSNGTVTFTNDVGKFELDVTTFQMAVLFVYNDRPNNNKMTFDNLLLATELPDIELRKTLWSLVALPKLKRQVLCYEPEGQGPKDFKPNTKFWVNSDFALIKNNRIQSRGKLNMIGRLQLTTERSREEDNESIVQLRILRVQEAVIKILKMRKSISNYQLQTELIDILKDMFLPSKKLIKEQIEWLIEHKYMKRDEEDINQFVYIT